MSEAERGRGGRGRGRGGRGSDRGRGTEAGGRGQIRGRGSRGRGGRATGIRGGERGRGGLGGRGGNRGGAHLGTVDHPTVVTEPTVKVLDTPPARGSVISRGERRGQRGHERGRSKIRTLNLENGIKYSVIWPDKSYKMREDGTYLERTASGETFIVIEANHRVKPPSKEEKKYIQKITGVEDSDSDEGV